MIILMIIFPHIIQEDASMKQIQIEHKLKEEESDIKRLIILFMTCSFQFEITANWEMLLCNE